MANGHGGKRAGTGGARQGAGRKPGAVTVRTREEADRDAAAGEIGPLEIVLTRMRAHWEHGEYDQAVKLAEIALPYREPRLSSVAVGGRLGVTLEVVEEIVDAAGGEAEAQGDGAAAPHPG